MKKMKKVLKYLIIYLLTEPIIIYLGYLVFNNCITTIK